MSQQPKGYRPPATAEELMKRYAAGERYFAGAQLKNVNYFAVATRDGASAARPRLILREANLSGANLSGADFSCVDFSSTNLAAANLRACDLGGVNLRGADLRRAKLNSVTFGWAKLHFANFSGADLSGADLRHAEYDKTTQFPDGFEPPVNSGRELLARYARGERNFQGAGLGRVDLSGADVSGCDLRKAYLGVAHLSRADFSDCDLSEASLPNANLRGAKLVRARLSSADLLEARLDEADLTGARLGEARLYNAFFPNAILKDAYLRGADVRYADLSGAELGGADLRGADLSRADLRGANLSGADLADTNLNLAKYNGGTSWPDDFHPPPNTAEGLLERYASGERDFRGASLEGVDLREADLSGADFRGASFFGAELRRCKFRETRLDDASFKEANLARCDFREASLTGADLTDAHLGGVTLIEADLRNARIVGAYFGWSFIATSVGSARAHLERADFRGANLNSAEFIGVDLDGANLAGAMLSSTVWTEVDLSRVLGLSRTKHDGPASIATDVFVASRGHIPERFLRGCGLSEWEISVAKLYDPDLTPAEIAELQSEIISLKASSLNQISPLFISYSHADEEFVRIIEKRLDQKGLRYWRDVHDLKAGRIERQLAEAIRKNEIVLLVLSKHSVDSDWVEFEVRKAREKEKKDKRDVLCPVALDDSWKTCSWPERLRMQVEEYNILDFSEWRDEVLLDSQFQKLLDGMQLFYRGKRRRARTARKRNIAAPPASSSD